MTFDNLTAADATRIRDVIRQLEAFENQQEQDAIQILVNQAKAWWDSIKPAIPNTRDEALDAFNFIKNLLDTETEKFRIKLLKNKLLEANEKYKERKQNG